MDPITIGTITLNSVEYQQAEEEPDDRPAFIVDGTVTINDRQHKFKRRVELELDGQDASEDHIDGFTWDDAEHIVDTTINQSQITEDLYNAIYASEAYQSAAKAYHGLGSPDPGNKIALLLTTEEADIIFDALDDAADSAIDAKRDIDDDELADQDAFIVLVRHLQGRIRDLLGKDPTRLYD